ncbi:hypothetical protein G7046_g8011 [Stylonectria norvegica]|nr:hypothetical protein G7046_g8011 [Stylonectria norvegica]
MAMLTLLDMSTRYMVERENKKLDQKLSDSKQLPLPEESPLPPPSTHARTRKLNPFKSKPADLPSGTQAQDDTRSKDSIVPADSVSCCGKERKTRREREEKEEKRAAHAPIRIHGSPHRDGSRNPKGCGRCLDPYGTQSILGKPTVEVKLYMPCGHHLGSDCLYMLLEHPYSREVRCPFCRVALIHACTHPIAPTREPPTQDAMNDIQDHLLLDKCGFCQSSDYKKGAKVKSRVIVRSREAREWIDDHNVTRIVRPNVKKYREDGRTTASKLIQEDARAWRQKKWDAIFQDAERSRLEAERSRVKQLRLDGLEMKAERREKKNQEKEEAREAAKKKKQDDEEKRRLAAGSWFERLFPWR